MDPRAGLHRGNRRGVAQAWRGRPLRDQHDPRERVRGARVEGGRPARFIVDDYFIVGAPLAFSTFFARFARSESGKIYLKLPKIT